MPDETLIAAAEPDGFTHESPIRAFTDFRVSGTWAIGKGFRPSLGHLHDYLNAMQNKEGWHLVQLLDGGTLDPTLIFQRDRTMAMTIPERTVGKHPALGAPYGVTVMHGELREVAEGDSLARFFTDDVDPASREAVDGIPGWMKHASDDPIPDEHYMEAAEFVIRRARADTPQYLDSIIRDFKKRFGPPKNHRQISHTSLARQLHFLLGEKPGMLRIKQLIDGFREKTRLERIMADPYKEFAKSVMDDPRMQPAITSAVLAVSIKQPDPEFRDEYSLLGRQPNVGDDPINPAYYDGTACAEIIEHMPTNVGIAAKYIWRLGEKDAEKQECGKAAWYLKRELAMQHADDVEAYTHGRARFGFATVADSGWYRRYADQRINAAQAGGKLTPERALALAHLVSYTITGEPTFLHSTIAFLESQECAGDYGRGLEP